MQPPPGGWPPPPNGYPPPPGYPPQQQGYGPPPSQGWGAPQGYVMVPVQAAPMFQCPMCRAADPPCERDKVSVAGWVIFAVLLLCCFPLCFIGLTQKEKWRVCSRCNHYLGKMA